MSKECTYLKNTLFLKMLVGKMAPILVDSLDEMLLQTFTLVKKKCNICEEQ